ncbi:MAG: T9SS type A sorting domain-containing protein [Bacteroidetes bacterium]|nr:MAG: T9SS type A sorting domain-containing protein [Bacteroidota bacterium]
MKRTKTISPIPVTIGNLKTTVVPIAIGSDRRSKAFNLSSLFKAGAILLCLLPLGTGRLFSQNTGINTTGAAGQTQWIGPVMNSTGAGNNDNLSGMPETDCPGEAGSMAINKLQTVFVKNQGQVNDDILYYSWFPQGIRIYKDRMNIYGTDIQMDRPFSVNRQAPDRSRRPGGERTVEGVNLQQGIFNYFGKNKSISNIPSYGEVVYENIYPGIDLAILGMQEGKVEFVWSIHPGGSVEDIRLEIKGAKVRMTGADEILVTPKGKMALHPDKIGNARPFTLGTIYAYQDKGKIEMQYSVKNHLPPFGKVEVSFIAGRYDKNKTLVIDPVVAATLITSTGTDFGYALAIDGTGGNIFIAGQTNDYTDFAPSRYTHGAASSSAFVTKLTNAGSHLATALIGSSSGADCAYAIAIDGAGNVFVAGRAGDQADFAPSRNVFGTTGGTEVFVTKLNNGLNSHITTAIMASSANSDEGRAIVINGASSDVFIAGKTGNQADFGPAGRAVFGTTGGVDAFVTKLNNALSSHTATAILAGGGEDVANALAIDGSGGNVFVAGKTATSSNFAPVSTTYGANPGSGDAFITKLNNALSSHTATSILAGGDGSPGITGVDAATAVAIDGVGGNVFVAGSGAHITVPCCGYKFANGASPQYVHNSGYPAAFVTKLDNALAYTASAIIGGGSAEVYALAIDGAGGNIIIAGAASSSYASSKSPPSYGTLGGSREAFATKLNNNLDVYIATAFVAGTRDDYAMAMVIDGTGGDVVLAGSTDKVTGTSDFASSRTYLGTIGTTTDAFVTRLAPDVLPVELIYFTSSCDPTPGPSPKERGVILKWATASETNNDYFTVEASPGPSEGGEIKWEVIGTVKGAGNSNTIRTYEFTAPFNSPEGGENSLPFGEGGVGLRLKQTDYNGNYEYFGPVSVNCNSENKINVLPTVSSSGYFTVTGLPPNSEFSAFNVLGEKVYSDKILNRKSLILHLDLPGGIYFVNIKTEKKSFVQKIIIQK